ncbi:MAG TPA: endo alpha-1,4 polygalactosaminidase [Anaerolineales bacterium]|nr:endo alpha-1,4 polygalactosaminidase [Anaerolineales bacterium]
MNMVPSLSKELDWWRPRPGLTWQWQLSEPPVDLTVDAQVFDIDLFDNDAGVVRALHEQGRKVIGYTSVGSREDWRPDANQFPAELLGNDYEGWPGEKWLDIRQIDRLSGIMQARLDLCAEKGFDGLEPDNIEIHAADTGFPISYQDQLAYAGWLAGQAHARGLAFGLKNAPDMLADALDFCDFAITEDAYYYHWIERMLPFIESGKPVFAAEYTDMAVDFEAACDWGRQHGVRFIRKNRILTAFRVTCP